MMVCEFCKTLTSKSKTLHASFHMQLVNPSPADGLPHAAQRKSSPCVACAKGAAEPDDEQKRSAESEHGPLTASDPPDGCLAGIYILTYW